MQCRCAVRTGPGCSDRFVRSSPVCALHRSYGGHRHHFVCAQGVLRVETAPSTPHRVQEVGAGDGGGCAARPERVLSHVAREVDRQATCMILINETGVKTLLCRRARPAPEWIECGRRVGNKAKHVFYHDERASPTRRRRLLCRLPSRRLRLRPARALRHAVRHLAL